MGKIKYFVRKTALELIDKDPKLILKAGSSVTGLLIINEDWIEKYPITLGDDELVQVELKKI